jgi:hypothetical protein
VEVARTPKKRPRRPRSCYRQNKYHGYHGTKDFYEYLAQNIEDPINPGHSLWDSWFGDPTIKDPRTCARAWFYYMKGIKDDEGKPLFIPEPEGRVPVKTRQDGRYISGGNHGLWSDLQVEMSLGRLRRHYEVVLKRKVK